MKCFQIFINVNLPIFKKKNFRLEKLFFLLKKCIYFISYRNEHPVYYSLRFVFANSINDYLMKKDQLIGHQSAYFNYIILICKLPLELSMLKILPVV